jgi:hypothetical protein
MINNMSDRFNKLRELREELCKKNNNWSEVFTLSDWLTKEDVINMLEDLICVVEPEEQNEK